MNKSVVTVTLENKFPLKDRFKVLFGFNVVNLAYVEVTAKVKNKFVEISAEIKQTQTFICRPKKKAELEAK